ncbi:phage major capsid protein [Alteriqipengyuania lutimaris]|uniref:Phage major capsid protein n=1 Tax=Alteriqipengyuania lutimaris TaxID=1538146 RepID=A0A395LI78_9SPHN|nr:phage major capsid protein [Alteriqipengyuania lutimaris]MBB3035384.1 HK97 family phage major capsid protein [Alteriqipengyuania lutimaris]RDS75967.1 phage major capsid protein [Alteriqipengyuania lutimaris]
MILQQYYQERGELVAEARQILDGLADDASETEIQQAEERHDAVMAKVDALDKKIAREERVAQAETAEEERRSRMRPNGRDGSAPGIDGGDTPTSEDRAREYRSAFAKFVCGAELSNEERQALRSVEQRVQTAGTPADGGYTVPTELMNEIVKAMKDWGPMFDEDVARVFTTASGNQMTIPTVDDTGVTPEAHAEGSQGTDDGGKDVTFGEKSLDAFAYDTEWIKWSFELDEDSIFAMEQLLGSLLGERLGRNGNKQLTVGAGGSAPNGVVTASSLGVTAAATGAIAADELIDLQHSVNAAYRRSPKTRWQFSDDTLKVIRKLKDGQGNYLWQMGDVRSGEPDQLLRSPYSVNDDVPPIAAGNRAIIYGDHSKYFVRKVGAVRTIVARERFAPNLGILGVHRFDGELVDTAAVKHLALAAA